MGTTLIEERTVLARAARGDKAAFGELVKAHQRRAYAAAYALVGNRDDAIDLAQDAFVRAYRAMGRFDTKMPFYPWLHRIVRNTCLNHLKRRNRRGETSLDALMEEGYDAESGGLDPVESAEAVDLRDRIRAAMATLTPQQQEILRLRHMVELSYTEIADCLQIPIGTVMSRLHAARKALKDALEKAEITSANETARPAVSGEAPDDKGDPEEQSRG